MSLKVVVLVVVVVLLVVVLLVIYSKLSDLYTRQVKWTEDTFKYL